MLFLKKYLFVLYLGASLFVIGCEKKPTGEPDESIVIGAIYNLTGDQTALDVPSSRGAELAIKQINTNGGVNGKELQLVLKDGQTNQDVLRSRVSEILAEYPATSAFMGLSDTDQVLPAAGRAADSGHVFLTSGATSPQLPTQIPDFLFLACFGDNVQAAAAAEWAYGELNARTVAVVYDSTEIYTQLLRSYFITRFTALGGQVVSDQAYGKGQLGMAVATIGAADFVFFSALPPDAPIGVQLIRQAGITVPVVGGDAYDEPAGWVDDLTIQDVYFTTHAYLGADNPDPRVQAFRKDYLEAYQEEPSAFSALGYDAVQLLAEALKNLDTSSSADLVNALQNIEDFPGVTGQISYGTGYRIPRKSVTIMEVRNGTQRLVTQLVPEQVPTP